MTFENTKKIIEGNIETIKSIMPNFGKTEKVINFMFENLKKAMESDDIPKFPAEAQRDVNCFISFYIKGLINLEDVYSDTITEVTHALSDVIDNFDLLYPNCIYPSQPGAVLRVLVNLGGNLQAQISLNKFMMSHLRELRDIRKENAIANCSRKYYTEITEFLNRRKSHDERYETQDICIPKSEKE